MLYFPVGSPCGSHAALNTRLSPAAIFMGVMTWANIIPFDQRHTFAAVFGQSEKLVGLGTWKGQVTGTAG